jgi:hypothetical protein
VLQETLTTATRSRLACGAPGHHTTSLATQKFCPIRRRQDPPRRSPRPVEQFAPRSIRGRSGYFKRSCRPSLRVILASAHESGGVTCPARE